jgi:phage shock protein A
MALIKRVSRLFTADLHAVLDRIEEPEALLRQAVREMEEALARKAQRLDSLERRRCACAKRAAEIVEMRAGLDAKLDVCFAADNSDLARRIVRRKLLAARLEQRQSEEAATLADEAETLRAQIGAQHDRLEIARQKLELFATEAPTLRGDGLGETETIVSDEEIEIALLEELRARARS